MLVLLKILIFSHVNDNDIDIDDDNIVDNDGYLDADENDEKDEKDDDDWLTQHCPPDCIQLMINQRKSNLY